MVAGETWAEEVYLDAVCALQSVSLADLGEAFTSVEQESAEEILEDAWAYFKDHPQPLAEAIYQKLSSTKPEFPPLRFSNGDLWLENFIARDKKLAGVIDFQCAAFSDPVFEFLLSFFAEPRLKGRGIEARYCQRIGVNPAVLHWYHGLEFLDTWRWVLLSGKGFVHHTAESLEKDIKNWLQSVGSESLMGDEYSCC
jgi:aminoglycoside phosphotransferase (APT) family kinase protein